ncbi:MAG: TetR/AcrR family transcriptional regulator, partial [Oscillospiraceae bacterium]|nr:TetR/AcrR family transcriptional regulator [Oscillospiraceae bacterium]
MTRKEEIIRAALELASENGLKAVSLSQIADRIGIKKPSLYNHFKSKDELVNGMYSALREHAKQNSSTPADFSALADKSLEEILLLSLQGYLRFLTDKDMLCFFRVLYSERSTSPAAARIMLDETERMVESTRTLFYALVVHG